MKSLILGVACLLVSFQSLADGQELKTQKLSFFAFGLPVFPASIYVRTGPETYQEVALLGANTTEVIDVVFNSESRAIHIYDKPEVNEEGVTVYPIIGKAKTNPGWREAFVVLAGEKKDERVFYNCRVFQLSDSDFPDGSIKFANFSKAPIQGLLGKGNVVKIKPGAIKTLRYKKPPGESIGVVFMYQQADSKQWRRMISTRWAVPKEGRRIMFAFQDPKGKSIRTKTLPIRR